jgi:hypothetical protein
MTSHIWNGNKYLKPPTSFSTLIGSTTILYYLRLKEGWLLWQYSDIQLIKLTQCMKLFCITTKPILVLLQLQAVSRLPNKHLHINFGNCQKMGYTSISGHFNRWQILTGIIRYPMWKNQPISLNATICYHQCGDKLGHTIFLVNRILAVT